MFHVNGNRSRNCHADRGKDCQLPVETVHTEQHDGSMDDHFNHQHADIG